MAIFVDNIPLLLELNINLISSVLKLGVQMDRAIQNISEYSHDCYVISGHGDHEQTEFRRSNLLFPHLNPTLPQKPMTLIGNVSKALAQAPRVFVVSHLILHRSIMN